MKKKKKNQNFLSENFQYLVVKFSVYLNRHVFAMTIDINVAIIPSACFDNYNT